jgi:phosphoglycolate phosphatase
MTAALVVFDLDGTLVDTAPDLVNTLNVILAQEGLAPVPFEEARTMIGGGARALLERGLRESGHPLSKDRIDGLFARFLDHYAAHIADRSRPFPGVEAALDALASAGFRLAICTNKLEWLARKLLGALGMTRRFCAIAGQDTFGVAKPDPVILRRLMSDAGADEARTIMVGDSETDIRLARAAGVAVVAVDFGYTETPVAGFGPDMVIGHFDLLVPAIQTLTRRPNPLIGN